MKLGGPEARLEHFKIGILTTTHVSSLPKKYFVPYAENTSGPKSITKS